MASRTITPQYNQVPKKRRPELGEDAIAAAHNYATSLEQSDKASTSVKMVGALRKAANIIYNTDKQLYIDGTVSSSMTAIPQIEKNFFDMASHVNISEGVFYYMAFEHKDEILVRYIESGCYRGLMENKGKDRVREQMREKSMKPVYFMAVYTEEDISRHFVKESSRPDRLFQQLLKKNKSSLMNQYSLLIEHMSKENSVRYGVKLLNAVLHCLRKQAKPNSINDRYINVYPESYSSAWDAIFTNYIVTGEQQHIPEDWMDSIISKSNEWGHADLSLQQQFYLISVLPNNHWDQYLKLDGSFSMRGSKVGLLRTLLYQSEKVNGDELESIENDIMKPSFYPTSIRNRLLFFMLDGRMDYINKVFRTSFTHSEINEPSSYNIDNSDNGTTDSLPLKRRRYTPRVVKVTPQMLHLATNLSPNRNCYINFRESMINDGCIILRSSSTDTTVFVLNDYCESTGHMKPLSYVHVTVTLQDNEEPVVHCSCSMYAYIQGAGGIVHTDEDIVLDASLTCMHCRFVNENLLKYCQQEAIVDDTLIGHTVRTTLHQKNNPIVVLPPARFGSVAKFSVRGQDGTCAFVHLSACGQFVVCTLGRCQAGMQNKKKTTKLLKLTESDLICEHLSILQTNKEIWNFLVPEKPQIPKDQENMTENYEDESLVINNDVHFKDGEWQFGGLSNHMPLPEFDIKLSRCVRSRASLIDSYIQRDKDFFLIGPDLIPDTPSTCPCGAGYDEKSTIHDFTTKVFTRYGVVKCKVLSLLCGESTCRLNYEGTEDALHMWSKDISAGDEIGWDFINRVLTSKISFTAFVNDMSRTYRTNFFMSPNFMSIKTFISWIFSWMSAMHIDFRKEVDPWCKYTPKILACDGTHVGVGIRQLNIGNGIEATEIEDTKVPLHKRFDRVFFSLADRQERMILRGHLRYLCMKALSNLDPNEFLLPQAENHMNQRLFNACGDNRVRVLLQLLINRECSATMLHQLAYFLKGLVMDAPLLAFLPWRYLDLLQTSCHHICNNVNVTNALNTVKEFSPELSSILQSSSKENLQEKICNFVCYLVENVKKVHEHDTPFVPPNPIPNTYNPEKGISYCFTDHGSQVRSVPKYKMSGNNNYDDLPEHDTCSKLYPNVSRGGYSYMFLWFCPLHGHCYGYHLIAGSEGRKDPFYSLYKYLPQPPEEVFYDFACSLSEYSLNREPSYFKSVRFWHDLFHGFGHKCPFCFRSARLNSLNVMNSEICEQFNSFIQCIKYTASHLSQSHFCFFMQFFISLWNRKKTDSFEKRVEIAIAGCQ